MPAPIRWHCGKNVNVRPMPPSFPGEVQLTELTAFWVGGTNRCRRHYAQ